MLRDAKAQHAEGVWQRNQLNRAKGSRGNCPLRSPEAAPLVGLGATPQLFHGRPVMPNALNPAALVAGSAASLRSNFARPQTRPQPALSTYSTLSRQMGATDQHREKSFSLGAGLFCCRDFASAEATRGLCGRPLDCFAAHTPIIDFVCCMENRVYGHNSGAQNPPHAKSRRVLPAAAIVIHKDSTFRALIPHPCPRMLPAPSLPPPLHRRGGRSTS